ncbi:hypothetical protein KI387_001647, partial [Taxus chinensis]
NMGVKIREKERKIARNGSRKVSMEEDEGDEERVHAEEEFDQLDSKENEEYMVFHEALDSIPENNEKKEWSNKKTTRKESMPDNELKKKGMEEVNETFNFDSNQAIKDDNVDVQVEVKKSIIKNTRQTIDNGYRMLKWLKKPIVGKEIGKPDKINERKGESDLMKTRTMHKMTRKVWKKKNVTQERKEEIMREMEHAATKKDENHICEEIKKTSR